MGGDVGLVQNNQKRPDEALLAVDLGLRTGLATFGNDGRLIWHRSHHFAGTKQLRRGCRRVLNELGSATWLVAEGDRRLFEIWEREASRRNIQTQHVGAEIWRRKILLDREQRSGAHAKGAAYKLALRVIEWSGIRRPTSLRHDTAEAILIGLWGVLDVGWLDQLPASFGSSRS